MARCAITCAMRVENTAAARGTLALHFQTRLAGRSPSIGGRGKNGGRGSARAGIGYEWRARLRPSRGMENAIAVGIRLRLAGRSPSNGTRQFKQVTEGRRGGRRTQRSIRIIRTLVERIRPAGEGRGDRLLKLSLCVLLPYLCDLCVQILVQKRLGRSRGMRSDIAEGIRLRLARRLALHSQTSSSFREHGSPVLLCYIVPPSAFAPRARPPFADTARQEPRPPFCIAFHRTHFPARMVHLGPLRSLFPSFPSVNCSYQDYGSRDARPPSETSAFAFPARPPTKA